MRAESPRGQDSSLASQNSPEMYIQVVGGSNYRVPVRVISGALRLRGNASFSQVQRDTKLKRRTIALVQ